MTDELKAQNTEQVFYLNDHPVIATAAQQLHPRRETVHRLHIKPESFRSNIPPDVSTVIVKQKKDEWDKEFENEKLVYQKLSPIQGDVIPQLYGEGSFNSLPAIFISDIPGPNLRDLAHSTTEIQESTLRAKLEKAMRTLHDFGAEYWDQKLDNFILSDGRIVVLDLEQVEFPKELDPWELNVNMGGVGSLMHYFRDIRAPEGEKSWNQSIFAHLIGQKDEDGNPIQQQKTPLILKRAKGRRYSFEECGETPKTFYLNNQPITAIKAQQLHPQRETAHRLYLEPGLCSSIPPNISTIIAKQKKEEWDKEFEDEKVAYQRLSTLQGEVIPQYYGEGMFDDLPAIFISDIPGLNLNDLARSTLEVQETSLQTELEKAMKALYDLGAEYWDQKLDNFILSGSKIVIVDLEQVQFPEELAAWERHINLGGAGYLARRFKAIRTPEDPMAYIKRMSKPAIKGKIALIPLKNNSNELGATEALPDEYKDKDQAV